MKFKPMKILGQRGTEPGAERLKPSQNFAGHSMYCVKCRGFRVQCFKMVGNGTPILEMRCYTCEAPTNFEFVAGGWVPESIVRTLEEFADLRIDAVATKPAEKVKTEPSETVQDLNNTSSFERRARHKAKLKMITSRVLETRAGSLLVRAFYKIREKSDVPIGPVDAISLCPACQEPWGDHETLADETYCPRDLRDPTNPVVRIKIPAKLIVRNNEEALLDDIKSF